MTALMYGQIQNMTLQGAFDKVASHLGTSQSVMVRTGVAPFFGPSVMTGSRT
jgi:hypothetical protein